MRSPRLSHLADLMSFSIIALSEFGQCEKRHNLRTLKRAHTTAELEEHCENTREWWTQTDAELYCISIASHHLERCAWTVLAAVIAASLPFTPKKPHRSCQPISEHFHRVYLLQSPEAGISFRLSVSVSPSTTMCFCRNKTPLESRNGLTWRWLSWFI